MADQLRFGIFQEDEGGPIWRESFNTVKEARKQACLYAEAFGREFFVYSFTSFVEIARFKPLGMKVQKKAAAQHRTRYDA